LLVKIGRHQEGIDCLERSVTLNPNDAINRFNLATAYNQMGNKEKVTEHLKMFIKLAPEHPLCTRAKRRLKQLERKSY
jgi:regulator of sirC expression with transglutaminase-like and TPR domain